MKGVFLAIGSLCLSFLCSCNSKRDSLYKNLYGPYGQKKISYHIDDDGWNILLRSDGEEDIFYSIEKTDSDTLKYLNLLESKSDKKVRVMGYNKRFGIDGEIHEVMMKLDTFYYFIENSEMEKAFIRGEYNYRFANALLTSDELDYYILHKDSLGSIRGNGLPRLPDLSEDEKLKLNEITNNN